MNLGAASGHASVPISNGMPAPTAVARLRTCPHACPHAGTGGASAVEGGPRCCRGEPGAARSNSSRRSRNSYRTSWSTVAPGDFSTSASMPVMVARFRSHLMGLLSDVLTHSRYSKTGRNEHTSVCMHSTLIARHSRRAPRNHTSSPPLADGAQWSGSRRACLTYSCTD